MENKALVSTDPSILLWLATAVVALLGLRASLEYLRRVGHEGPGDWRDLALAALAAKSCVWATAIVGIAGQGVSYPVGYSALILFGTLLLAVALAIGALAWMAWRPGWLSFVGGSVLLAAIDLFLLFGVIRAIGAEPGLVWRWPLLAAAGGVFVAGHVASLRLVVGIKRASKHDTGARRFGAALIAAVALIGALELTLAAAGLSEQSVSAYARQLPEVAVALLAGAALPIVFVVMIVDQHMQRRIRAASRRQQRRQRGAPADTAAASTQAPLPPSTH